jgi:thiosulfate reductase cytochrome b subunit
MADSVYIAGLAARDEIVRAPRHQAIVRVTHWVHALSFLGLAVSGVGILLAHPRFYWGETGGIGTPSLFDLPLPFMLGGPSGWGRSLHFESAWVCVLTGLMYVASGVATRHFSRNLAPARKQLTAAALRQAFRSHFRFERPADDDALHYNLLQRITYLGVVSLLAPLMIWTGLAMSPAVTSVFPALVNVLGGHQTARTIHFFAAVLLVLFLLVHVAMVIRAGFGSRVGAMITGRVSAGKVGV